MKRYRQLTLWGLWALFLLPLTLACVLYYTPAVQWIRPKTNGILLTTPLSTTSIPVLSSTKTWTLWYVVGPVCEERCQSDLKQLRNAKKALGKEQHRVVLRTIEAQESLPPFLTPGTLALVDPLDWLMLYYKPDMPYKGMLSDLRRLLKYSRIG